MEISQQKEKELKRFCEDGVWSSHLLPTDWVKNLLIDQIKACHYGILFQAAGIDTEKFDDKLSKIVRCINKEINNEI